MSLFSKILTKVFGKKSDKDIKRIMPKVELINKKFKEIESWDENKLKNQILHHKAQIIKLRDSVKSKNDSDNLSAKELDELIYEQEQNYLNDNLPEVYAVVKDAARRLFGTEFNVMGQTMTWDMVHYDVQLIGGIVLHEGNIAEMKTGEGKTLVSTLPIVLNALTGRGVHVITVNDYLAQRDSQWMGHLYSYLGLSVGCILNQMAPSQRKEQYSKDITYGTNNEFGFDYLRDNMSVVPEDQVQSGHVFGIVDEVDSVLIDEARTPLIISGQVDAPNNQKYKEFKKSVENVIRKQMSLVNSMLTDIEALLETDNYKAGEILLTAQRGMPKHKRLLKLYQLKGTKKLIHKVENDYLRDKKLHEIDEKLLFSIEEKSGIIDLTEKGREVLSPSNSENFIIPDLGEEFHKIDQNKSFTSKEKIQKKEEVQSLHAERSDRIHAINQLLKAYTLFEKDVDYIVQDKKVLIIDEHTGRIMHGRRFSDGLHQSLEAKENVEIERETQTMATITIQNYFRMYEKLAGMTGTALTEAGEFMQIYKLDVVEIPTNKPVLRKDNEDLIYKTKNAKYNAVIDKITELFKKGQPVLVGTTSVEESETLSRMLRRKKISHNVLNAKQHQKEAEIITNAGAKNAITISTNMAGRGTDIKLSNDVKKLGGLYILGTGRHESRRIDLQLRGRAGRQGDLGESTFYISLEDNLMRLFGSERIANAMDRLGMDENENISHSMISNSIERAQKKVEARNFSIRKHLLEYDDVMNQQREIIYDRRNFALLEKDINPEIQEILNEYIDNLLELYCQENIVQLWDWDNISADILSVFSLDINQENSNLNSKEDLKDLIIQGANAMLDHKKELVGSEVFEKFEKFVILRTIDEKWREHLAGMDQLREGINLRAYGQKNPLIEYKREGFGMFTESMVDTNAEMLKRIFRARIGNLEQQPIDVRNVAKNLKTRHDESLNMSYSLNAQSKSQVSSTPQFPSQTAQRPQKIQPIITEKKLGRNDRVTIKKGDKTKTIKYKKAEKFLADGWNLVEI
ncbi:MAG: preprotein translocase subunit SecA [Candidatus Neomarinimicrobiota bacterium]|nr:preprotein translocase subunit SecA [Candidatus Neomarinimicrobiota bacterium]